MKDIVLFPGDLGVFFQNEIKYIKHNYNIKAIIVYSGDIKESEDILNKYELTDIPFFYIDKLYFNPFKFLKWIMDYSVYEELLALKGKKKLKKIFYACMYGMHALSITKILNSLDLSINTYLYSFWATRSAYGIAYYKKKYRNDLFTICRAHGYDLYENRSPIGYLPFRKFINEFIDKIAFISKDGYDYFLRKYPRPFNKCISYLGCNNIYNIKKKIRKKNNICIVSCSSIIQVKRLDNIIALLRSLNGLDVTWIHIGTGRLKDDIEKQAYEQLKETTVKFYFLGHVENQNIIKTYYDYDADFFINQSDSEGVPVSIMEASAFGIPSIARDVGGVKEIVSPDCGLLFAKELSENDLKIFKNFIFMRISDVDSYRRYADCSYKKWVLNFQASKNLQEFFSI